MPRTANLEVRKSLLKALKKEAVDGIVTAGQIKSTARKIGTSSFQWLKTQELKVSHGSYLLPKTVAGTPPTQTQTVSKVIEETSIDISLEQNLVPAKDPNFVKFGFYADLKTIVGSKMFYPVFITGLSGNGKTHGAQQVCAALKRECITIPITVETDESDLLGDKTLVDGNIRFVPGPVVRAMETGAVLILDEIDLASNKIMCLQSIIDGKGVFLKKDNRFVIPKKGFTVIATANTKGKGSDDGRFIGTNVLNEAFLERFKVTFEQEYPTQVTEKKILNNYLESFGVKDAEFAEDLTVWASAIRKTFMEGGCDELISTRRLVHIVETFSIFKNKMKSIELCVSRFDEDTKASFIDLFEKISDPNEEFQDSSCEGQIPEGSDYASDNDTAF